MQNTLGTYDFDEATGVATITMAMEGGVNKVNGDYGTGWQAMLEQLGEQDGLKGVIVASGHRDWCVGADLDLLFGVTDPQVLFDMVTGINQLYRGLETLGVPVVAALTGSALGGGYELALSCHHRIALNDARIQLGLPEAMLGVIPGAGGTQRLPRLLGMQAALELLTQGSRVRAPKAAKKGLVDQLVDTPEALREAALAWIADNPRAKQPWDSSRFRFPGGVQPNSLEAMNLYTAGSALLYKKTAGAYRAPEVLLQVVQEGCRMTLDRALEREARAFAAIATSDQAKDMIRTLWYHKNACDKHVGLPSLEGADAGIAKITILGAGMMGAGLAFLCAKAGYDVVLKDIKEEPLQAAQARVDDNLKKARHLSADQRAEISGRITMTTDYDAVKGTDLIIEAVVENIGVKHSVIREVEPLLADGAVFASNTSALPITDLAKASAHPDRFIGLHYFSPVEKMPLIEVIRGEQTSDETVARCLDFARRTKKTPIVVNDGYGFYTTRLFAAYVAEGVELLAEGHDPRLIEWAARTAGMAVGPLQVYDEVTLTLGLKAITGAVEAGYVRDTESDGFALLKAMVEEHGRTGRSGGAGFYAYDDKGRRQGFWEGLDALTADTPELTGIDYVRRRLMLAQVAEVGRVLDAGVLQRFRDAEVGAILGLGFAPNSGGPLAWMQRYGLIELVNDLEMASQNFGERYAPSETLMRMAASGERFFDA